MSNFNLGTGYGVLDRIGAGSGNKLFVGPVGYPGYTELFQSIIPDPMGKLRLHSTIQEAVDAADAGDTIYVVPGSYDESVVISTANVTVVGLGGRGSVFIEPSTAGAEGLQVTADDVTLVNIGVDGDDTATYSLNLNAVSRFRAYGCKFELGSGAAPVVLIDGTATDQTADALFDDCEFAWSTRGIMFDDSAYGYPTQIFIQNSRFHNLSGICIGENASGGVVNLEVTNCVFDNMEDGTAPTDRTSRPRPQT